ncbi:MAG: twin-arginine translocation signal domain-containing protein, partial [Thermomicrobiales bacterium]
MKAAPPDNSISRRTVLAGAAAGGAALALAERSERVNARQESLADHPLAGTWMVFSNPILAGAAQVQNVAVFSADGACLLIIPPTDVSPDGVVLQTPSVGMWEAYDDRRGHFTATQILSDLDGKALGSLTVDGVPLVDADGASVEDDNEMVIVAIRDP